MISFTISEVSIIPYLAYYDQVIILNLHINLIQLGYKFNWYTRIAVREP